MTKSQKVNLLAGGAFMLVLFGIASEEMNDQDLKTIQTMIRFGGSFVSNLGKAALCADANNLQKIKDAFHEY